MSLLYRKILRPAVFLQDSEKAHNRLISTLSVTSRSRLLMSLTGNLYGSPDLPVNIFGLQFPNPLGIAAGLDKNGAALPAWQGIGFGFSEIGGVTLHNQLGNPKPRMFRATAERALVNRMGFNNIGAELVHDKLEVWKNRGLWPGTPVGVNLGKSKITPLDEAPNDYAGSMKILWNHADFFVINVSSPNTPNLRALQGKKPLTNLLSKIKLINEKKIQPKPILVKISPDLNKDELLDIIEIVKKLKIDGVIATNTTLSREGIDSKNKNEDGGLSGRPLGKISTEVIRFLAKKGVKLLIKPK